MLGTASTETDQLRDRLELADTIIAALEAADDSLRRAAPEEADSARYELVMAARRGVNWWQT